MYCVLHPKIYFSCIVADILYNNLKCIQVIVFCLYCMRKLGYKFNLCPITIFWCNFIWSRLAVPVYILYIGNGSAVWDRAGVHNTEGSIQRYKIYIIPAITDNYIHKRFFPLLYTFIWSMFMFILCLETTLHVLITEQRFMH